MQEERISGIKKFVIFSDNLIAEKILLFTIKI